MHKIVGILLLIILLFPQNAGAVPPPDFIIQVASQISTFFSIAVVFLLAIFTTSYQFLKARLAVVNKKIYWAVGILLILIVAGLGAYYYDQSYQKAAQKEEYNQWLDESIENSSPEEKIQPVLEVENPIESEDPGEKFLKNYYNDLAQHDFKAAYEVSKKSVSFEVFSSWYQNVEKIDLKSIEKQDQDHYLVDLTLWEEGKATHYQTLFRLGFPDDYPTIQMLDSKVTIFPDKLVIQNLAKVDSSQAPSSNFWEAHKNTDLKITNKDFDHKLKSDDSDYLILDARENIENEYGRLPGSTHIRFADLKTGEWKNLPQDKYIYVLCWSGIRGKEVAEYLRSNGLIASYLESGLDGWVSYGGKWEGEIKFIKIFPDARYQLVFDTATMRKKVEEGIKIVDSRSPEKFAKHHLPGAVNIPLMETPTIKLETVFSQLSPGGKVITVCDEYVNCFDARLTGVELERRGYEFLGRYNKPWEY